MARLPSLLTAIAALIPAVFADYYIEPDSVALTIRQQWCTSEIASCPLICEQVPPGTTTINTCDPVALTYGCLCGNGLQPNISEYSLTLPYFVCQQWGTQCVANCGQDNACSSDCRQNHPCGALHPQGPNTTTTSSTVSATATAASGRGTATTTGGQVFTGLGGSTATATPSGSFAAAAVDMDMMWLSLGLIAGLMCWTS